MLLQLINILPFGIVNPLQTMNVINSKKNDTYLTIPPKDNIRFSEK